MPTLGLPRPDDLHNAPERAALALLDAALAVARAALLAENPDVAALGDPVYERDPPPTTLLAARLVARSDALHDLLTRYLHALDDLDHKDDDPPF
ncbi:MAG TPA: hypothetical protein VEJ23_02330 [Solirubrobacteraceae bacterium]|nr:hypothetical protein [Solirubrobacteraceae bacterium]